MHTNIQASLRKALHVILFLGIFLPGAGSLSFAQAQGELSLFTAIELDTLDAADPPQAAIRSRIAGLNLSVLSGPQGDVGSQSLEGSTIRMNLFDDTVYDVVIDSIEASASGGTAWNGHIEGLLPSYAYMVYTDGVFAAHVASLEGVYEVGYAAQDVYQISQLDHSLYPDDIVLEPVLPENALPAVEPDISTQAITYIDVMVVYTARAVTAVGGVSAMTAKIDLAVQETNQSYINSNLNQRLNLVYQGQVTYDEGTNPDFGTTLNRLTGKVDSYMDNVHALRDTHSADLVSLVVEGSQYCGIAWLMSSPSVSFESDAFSVVAQSCATGYYSFAHELGHNMGSRHDTYVDSNNTPYPYSHGFTYPTASWRTIMAYDNACIAVDRNCTRLQYWSNPGVSQGGVAMGNASTADNHTSLNNTAATVAAFRTSAVDANVHFTIGGTEVTGSPFTIPAGTSIRKNFPNIDGGPVEIESDHGGSRIVAAERVIYKVNGVDTSFSEMMGLPDNQVDTTYWLPWYNSKTLNTQLRIANVSNTEANVHVRIGGAEVTGSPFTIPAGVSIRKNFANIDKGPVEIVSNVDIVAAERVIYKVNDVHTSFSEMMAMPASQMDTTYWLPWYNSKTLDTQLRIANVSNAEASVHVTIGNVEVTGSPFTIPANTSIRKTFPNIDKGPVEIESDQDIVAAERVIYKVNGVNTSFTEMMALPASQVDTTYWLPWYNSKTLDTQLRIANVSNVDATVHITIGGTEVLGSPFTIRANTSIRKTFSNIDRGPVEIVSDHGGASILAAERVIYKVNGVNTSFTEMMGLPDSVLDLTYWLPWYNSKTLDTQLRFGAPSN